MPSVHEAGIQETKNPDFRRQRVAVFIKHLSIGGLQRILVRMANELAARGLEVDLVVAKGKGPLLSQISSNVRFVPLHSKRLWYAVYHLKRYLSREQPDVLLAAGWQVNLIAIWARMLARHRVRLVISVRTNTTEQAKSTKLWYASINPTAVRIFYPLADAIIAVSRGVRDDLHSISHRVSAKTTVIYNPVVDDDLLSKAQQDVSHSWFDERDIIPVIVSVGRLDPQKNFSLLLRAFREVLDTRQARLVLVGDGSERRELEQLAADLKIDQWVHFAGFKQNPYPYLANANLFVLSSNFEGFGLVLVEALACGCPIVSTDCPSGPREILEDGRWGRLVPPADSSQLAHAMLESLQSDHDYAALRKRAMHFSVDRAANAYIQVMGLQTPFET